MLLWQLLRLVGYLVAGVFFAALMGLAFIVVAVMWLAIAGAAATQHVYERTRR